ncbi:hypothetical protein [Stomatohabitans albus]|uniref:hypothetical protein n=1 Tax=Stomatohabitans albus TaxID=3110766 RepID=UPI00300D045D
MDIPRLRTTTAPAPVQEPTVTDYLPTRREEGEGRHHHGQQDRGNRSPSQPQERAGSDEPQTIPNGTFLNSLDSLEPLFERYQMRIPHLVSHLAMDQRHLLGALYTNAEAHGYDLARIDALAKRFAQERCRYAERTIPNPVDAAGLVIDTQA